MKKRNLISCLVIASVLILISSIHATTITVPNDYVTIQEAINASNSGDTVLVSSGIYTEVINFLGKQLVVTSIDGRENTVIQSPTLDSAVVYFINSEPKGTVISGFSISGGGHSGIFVDGASPAILDNIIDNNYSISSNDGGGIDLNNTSGVVVSRNIIRNNYANTYGSAIHSEIADGDTISYNLIYACEGVMDIRCLGANTVIHNNTIDASVYSGIANQDSDTILCYNNLVLNASNGNGVYAANGGSAIVEYNIAWNCANGITGGTSIVYEANNLDVNPNLNADYTLGDPSPAVNAGNPDPYYNDSDSTRNDIGAFECYGCTNGGGGGPIDTLVNLVQWPISQGGNDHWYAVLPIEHFWEDANVIANSFMHNNIPGHLATVNSQLENDFILSNVILDIPEPNPGIENQSWLGGIDLGNGDWSWVTGEQFLYTNWASGEPNNLGNENVIAMRGNMSSEPGKWNNAPSDGTYWVNHQYWSIVEFGVDSTTGGGGGDTSSTSISLANVIGSPNPGEISSGMDVKFQLRVTNNSGRSILGITNGFRVYSPDGAEWGTLTGDTIGSIGMATFNLIYKIDYFGVNGSGADSVFFGGASIFSNGLSDGFDEVSYEVTIGHIDPIYEGKTICIDSSFIPPAGVWKWAASGEDFFPAWDGPHCFTVVPYINQGGESDSLILQTVNATPGINTLAVSAKLTQPIKGATIPLAIPEGIEVLSITTDGLITDSWDYKFLQIKQDSGFIFVSLANSFGAQIPVGTTELFNITFTGANSSCDQPLQVHFDTTLSGDISRRLTYVSQAVLPIQVGFDINRDYVSIPALLPGDFDNNGYLDISDLVATVDFMFLGGTPPLHMNILDMNGDCIVADISDLVKFVDFLFLNGDPLRCGCSIHTNKQYIQNNDIQIYTEYKNGKTIVSVNSEVILKGLEFEILNSSSSELIKLSGNNLNLYYHTDGQKTKAGLIDLKGNNTIKTGKTELLSIDGDCEIVSALVADENAQAFVPIINNKLSMVPDQFGLSQNYPNPFNPTTTISFQIPIASDVKLNVYNIQGQLIGTAAEGYFEAGEYTITWNGEKYSSGIYLYRLETESFTTTKKMMLIK